VRNYTEKITGFYAFFRGFPRFYAQIRAVFTRFYAFLRVRLIFDKEGRKTGAEVNRGWARVDTNEKKMEWWSLGVLSGQAAGWLNLDRCYKAFSIARGNRCLNE
jgi:hypothetical protein